MLKAIETSYNGYIFRSRIEARWATFFDALKLLYRYEDEGFDLSGVWYLPDFYLPTLDCYFEIKGDEPKLDEVVKAKRLSLDSGKSVFITIGSPWFDVQMSRYCRGIQTDCARFPWIWFICEKCQKPGLADVILSRVDKSLGFVACDCRDRKVKSDHPVLDSAFKRAREARFEMKSPI